MGKTGVMTPFPRLLGVTDGAQVLVEVWHMAGEFCSLLLPSVLTGMVNGGAGAPW